MKQLIPEYSNSPEDKDIKFPEKFEVLIVLAKGWKDYLSRHEDQNKPLRLSMESKMVALAAGEMYNQGIIEKILISGGKTAGQDKPSEAEAIVDYLLKKYPNISVQNIILDEQSADTVEAAREVTGIIKTHEFKGPIAMVAVGFHTQRGEMLFEQQGLAVHPFPSEEELVKRSPHYQEFVDKYRGSFKTKLNQAKEAVMRNLLYIDPTGKIPAMLTHGIRHANEREK